MQSQLLNTIGVVIACVAFQVHWVPNGHTFESPLVGLASFFDVCHKLIFLHVLICLTVQLEVGLELGVVTAELTLVGIANECFPLLLGKVSLNVHVQTECLQVVRGESVADGTLEKLQGRVVRGRERFAEVHEFF